MANSLYDSAQYCRMDMPMIDIFDWSGKKRQTATVLPFPPSMKFREELMALMEKYGGKECDAMIADLRYAAAFLEGKKLR